MTASKSKLPVVEYVVYKSEGVWNYFLREKATGEAAQCKDCGKVLKCGGGGSTKGLHVHLKTMHKMYIQQKWSNVAGRDTLSAHATESDSALTTGTKKKSPDAAVGPILKFLVKNIENSLQATLSRMVACDGLPFRIFITSPDVRKGLEMQGFTPLPKSKETIKQLVMEHGEMTRRFVASELAKLKADGKRFSLTFDEWTSTRNKRYMNNSVHVGQAQFWSLGMVRILGSMPAEKCVDLLEMKLSVFGLSLQDDIVGICTDGASVMKKVGRLISAKQQLCYAHGIHLAVMDVLYKRPESPSASMANIQSDDSDDEDEEDEFKVTDINVDDIAELSEDYQTLVKRIRMVIKIFRRSPTRNDDVLQKYVRAEIGQELNLILDCKTRWNSLFEMLSRVIRLRSCILKAMIDVKSQVHITDADFESVQEIVTALQPVKLVVEALCHRDINLITADAAVKFALQQLEKQCSELAKNLAVAVRARISERRNEFAGILQYLNNPRATNDSTFTVAKSSEVKRAVVALLLHLHSFNPSMSGGGGGVVSTECNQVTESRSLINEIENNHSEDEHSCEVEISLQEQLELAMKDSLTQPSFRQSQSDEEKDLTKAIKTEMVLFESNGNCGLCLQKAYEFLMTIPATSVEAERAFSAAGIICTKVRTRLGDETIDTLCFL
ncbi:uncharacterized protein LOC134932045 [Pseudophryne corroboree]|uniref:uncharacterized protein LOC134932045 n=1 Tax=Pseudophryne corroboree TaxID=495146 RepID=UPI003081CD95